MAGQTKGTLVQEQEQGGVVVVAVAVRGDTPARMTSHIESCIKT